MVLANNIYLDAETVVFAVQIGIKALHYEMEPCRHPSPLIVNVDHDLWLVILWLVMVVYDLGWLRLGCVSEGLIITREEISKY